MRRIGEVIFKWLTCLSLLASIGSFIISALPVINDVSSTSQNQASIKHLRQIDSSAARGVSRPATRSGLRDDLSETERAELKVRSVLWFVAFCAGALALIRLIRVQRGDF
jgi:hypothetical protein